MRVVIAVGGSVLAPELSPERIEAYADVLTRVADTDAGDTMAGAGDHGTDVAVVVGGGQIARQYIEAARALDTNEIALDDVGIGVTRLNARLLAAAVGERAPQEPPTEYETAARALRRGDLPVMGGAVAGQTTDAVAAALAEYVGADRLVYATSVDGVYDADPNVDADAQRYDSLTPDELVDVVADVEMRAGSAAPVDLLAAKLIQRSGLRAVVLDGSDPEAVADAALGGPHDGTDIAPP
ncbi:MAG: UMP kinase [Halobacteriaceae archaeon]